MTPSPAFIAYAVRHRPGGRPSWLRIGAAFARQGGPGLTLRLNALPLGGRIVLIEPRVSERPKPVFFPSTMPTDLAIRPALRGEKRVWEALQQAPLSPRTRIFYNRAAKGLRRRADFLILDPGRGVIAIEVKGGRLHYRDGFRQSLAGKQPWSKRIEPWLQSRRALAETIGAAELNPFNIPQAVMLAMPHTRADMLPFPATPHMLTAEEIVSSRLARKLERLLPRLDPAGRAALAPALESLASALTAERQCP
jgi:hypothetical protein